MLETHSNPTARRRQVVDQLSAVGLGKRRLLRSVDSSGKPAVERLCGVLPELGPLFVAFGRYMATRPDLLDAPEIGVLSQLRGERPPLPASTVLLRVAAELGLDQNGLEKNFVAFDPLPLSSDVVSQQHRAQLKSGATAVVRYVHPSLPEEKLADGDLLPLIGPAFEQLSDEDMAAARDDFFVVLDNAAALDRQVNDLSGWQTGTNMAIPQVMTELSSRHILTCETLAGIASSQRHPLGTTADQQRAFEQSRHLAHVWLRQVLTGPAFPLFSGEDDLLLLPGGQLGLASGPFASLQPATQRNLGDFLQAVAGHDPDRAVEALCRELDGGSAEARHRLRQRCRQLVPLREGDGLRDDLTSHIVLYWRFAQQEGFRPRPSVLPFYRGLNGLDRHLRRLSTGDALRSGFEATQLVDGFEELAKVFSPAGLGAAATDSIATLMQLPRQLDQLLNQATDGGPEIRLQMTEPPEVGRRKDASAMVVACLLAMVGLALAADQLQAVLTLGPWFERLAVVLFVILGIHLLRGLGRWS